MNCPNCNVPLVMSERQGIEIDYCPDCRGIWLDRGELDKIIEKSTLPDSDVNHPFRQPFGIPDRDDDHSPRDYYKHRKKKNWLNDLFD
ncbi:MAG: zf-TFIIB domain-containing protein [Lentimicrobium sp.]